MLMSLFEECAVGAVGWMNVLVADGSLVHMNLSSKFLVASVRWCHLGLAFLINLKCDERFDGEMLNMSLSCTLCRTPDFLLLISI